jgi:hypothetical protein
VPAQPDSRFLGFAMASKTRRRLSMVVWACTISGLLAILQYLQPPSRSLAWIAFLNAGHAPLFGAIALAMLQLLLATPLANRSRLFLYGLALGLTILMGAFSEWLQIGADRNSDPRDFARDALGACAFLLAAATWDRCALLNSRFSSGVRASCRGAALGMLTLAFTPGVLVAYAYAERAAALPALCDFAGTWETNFVTTSHAHLEHTSLPRASGGAVSAWHITFEPARFSTLKLVEPYPDWAGYQRLRVVAQSELDRPIDLVLRIHDRHHDGRYSDRFNRSLTFLPGINEFVIPLAEIRSAPEGREMDLSAIRRLSLFAVAPKESFSLYLLELDLN